MSITSVSERLFRWNAITCSVTDTSPKLSSTPRRVAPLAHLLDDTSVSFLGWV